MTDPVKRTARKTLKQLGSKGGDDRVRVLEDEKADEVIVQYKDGRGVPRKKVFPHTRQGRKDAIAWGEAYHQERAKGVGGRPQTTHLQLWKAYSASPAFLSRRIKTRENYTERYRKWMHFRGERTRVDDTTLLHVDQFYHARKEAKKSANQTRSIIGVARLVYAWGQSRKLVAVNELALYRWSTAEGEEAHEPEEYSEAEFNAILAELPAQSARTWRAHVALMLAGHQGMRANAVLHLRWEDTFPGSALFIWPAEFQKNRRDFPQPMTWDAVAALETARYWRERLGYTGRWVIFAGGGNTKIGPLAPNVSRGVEYQPKTQRGYRKGRTGGEDTAYTYQAWHRAVYGGKNKDGSRYVGAEARAGVEHKERRAFHANRKMVAGNVSDRTNDARLGMEFIGDRDMKQAKKYLKRRDERMERAADAIQSKAPEQKAQGEAATVLELSPETQHEKAPAVAGAEPMERQ